MKRQRYHGKVFAVQDSSSSGVKNRNMQAPSADLWMTPNSYSKNDLEMSEVVPRELDKKFPNKSSTDEKNSIKVVLIPYIVLGQCFGILPVHNVLSNSPEDVSFSWISTSVVVAIVFFCLNLALTVGQVYGAAVVHGFNFFSINNIFTSTLTTVQGAITLQQARTWPGLMTRWTRVEKQMSHFHPLAGLTSTVKSLVYVFCLCSLFLAVARLTSSLVMVYNSCDSLITALHLALLANFNVVPIPSSIIPARALLLTILFVRESVVLVYDELTIIVLSYSLCLRFRQLNSHLKKVCSQRIPVEYWAEMRITYNSLSCLAQHLNSHLSWMTLVSFAASLFEIGSLLHLILSPEINVAATWTILYVLVFSVVRMFYAALMASSIGEESKKPLYQMFSVPSESYSAEVCRFQMQVSHGDIAISGMDFFSVTRSFMLTVAGTIVTYEIVLIQSGTTGVNRTSSINNTDNCYNMLALLDLQV